MHRLWTIPEIVLIICSSLDRRDEVHLALVNRCLWANVIHLIWKKVSGIKRLAALVDRTNDHSAFSQELGPVTGQQWDRYDLYSKFIKDLKIELNGYTIKSFEALGNAVAARKTASGSPVFFAPAIRHLTVVNLEAWDAVSMTQEWELLLPETLFTLHLFIRDPPHSPNPTAGASLSPFFRRLRTSSRHLRRLTLDIEVGFGALHSNTQDLLDTIRALEQLTQIGIHSGSSMPLSLANEILSIRRLDRLFLGALDLPRVEGAPPVRHTLHNLNSVGLIGNLGAIVRTLKSIDPSTVKHIMLSDTELQTWGFDADDASVVDVIGRFTALDRLELNVAIEIPSLLLPLRSVLQGLVYLSLSHTEAEPWVTEENFHQLASLLPNIEVLHIIGHSSDPEAILIPLSELRGLATTCPQLQNLRIPILAGDVTMIHKIQAHPSLREIDLRNSMIEIGSQPSRVAFCMATMFPKLQSLTYFDESDDMADSEDSNDGSLALETLVEELASRLPSLRILPVDHTEGVGSFGNFFLDDAQGY